MPGPRDGDPYNVTDPESRITKNPTNAGFHQHDNAQLAVAQESLFIVGYTVSNYPTDQHDAEPTVASIPSQVGTPAAAVLDTGYFSAANIQLLEAQGITLSIAPGRASYHQGWRASCAHEPAPLPEDATPRETMAHTRQTAVGQAIYRRRICTSEPVFRGGQWPGPLLEPPRWWRG